MENGQSRQGRHRFQALNTLNNDKDELKKTTYKTNNFVMAW